MAGRKPGPSRRLSDTQILMAARRYYMKNESQAAIAHDLEVSTSHLARLLASAREKGWVKIFVEAPTNTVLEHALLEAFSTLRVAFVVPGGQRLEAAKQRGSIAARWLDGILDRDVRWKQPLKLAVGGGATHASMVDALVPRSHLVDVGPTALTPFGGRMQRLSAPSVAMLLAYRLGAIKLDRPDDEDRSRGAFVCASVSPRATTIDALRELYTELERLPGMRDVLAFWAGADIVFASVGEIGSIYPDVWRRIEELGASTDELRARGAVGVVANQAFDAHGCSVAIADGVPSYEPAMPLDAFRKIVARDDGASWVVLGARAGTAAPARALLESRSVNVLVCDLEVAEALVR